MRINKTASKKYPVMILVTMASLLVIGYLIYAYVTKDSWPFREAGQTNSSSTKNPTTTSDETNESASSSNTTGTNTSSSTENKTPTQYETSSSDNNSLVVTINYSQVIGDSLQVRVTIDRVLSSGTCSLTLTGASGTTVSRTAELAANPSSSTCQGFNIPVAELSSGKWTIMLDVSSGDLSGTASSEITI